MLLSMLLVEDGGAPVGDDEARLVPRADNSFSDRFLRSQHTLFSRPIRLRATIPWQ
jgi:hypothetical protein